MDDTVVVVVTQGTVAVSVLATHSGSEASSNWGRGKNFRGPSETRAHFKGPLERKIGARYLFFGIRAHFQGVLGVAVRNPNSKAMEE
jgi:hypothetical protein